MESFDKKTGELRYYASETAKKTKTITIPKKAVYVYNGTPLQGALEDKLTEFINGSRKGSIKIIESTDAQYARVIIKSYETIIAKAYENYVLYDAYDADKNINIKGYDVVRIRSKYESDIALPQTFPNAPKMSA